MGLEELILDMERKRGMKLGKKLGEKRGMERNMKQVVINMLNKNLQDEMIADLVNVSLEYVQEIKSEVLKNNMNK